MDFLDNMMRSINQYILDNRISFGLNADAAEAEKEMQLIKHSREDIPPGARRLIVTDLRTLPDSRLALFGNLLVNAQPTKRFETQVELELKMRAADPKDFYWNDLRKWRDQVYKTLAGSNDCGIKIPRYDWTDEDNPVQDGEIWFVVDERRPSPIEDPLEDPDNPAIKSIFQTWLVRWTRKI